MICRFRTYQLDYAKWPKKKITEAKSEFLELLNEISFAYRIIQKTSIGETLFLLAYETKAMIPTKIRCPIYRVVYYTSKGNHLCLKTTWISWKKPV